MHVQTTTSAAIDSRQSTPAPSQAPWARLAVALFALLYCAAHGVTLTRTPLPWADETFFASMTDSLARQGTLHVLAEPITYPTPLLIYGPVYFALSVPFEWIFGVTQLMSRLPGLIFGLGVIAVVFMTLRTRGVSRAISFIVCALLALDHAYSGSLHMGRMDTTALFFYLASFLLLLRSGERKEGSRGLLYPAASGLLAALGLLTTPRPGYLVVAMGLVLFARVFRGRPALALAQLGVWSGVIIAIYLIWVFGAFGSIKEMLVYYRGFVGDYVGASTFNPRQLLLFALTLGTLAALALLRPRELGDELLIFSLLGTVGYFALVKEFGGTYTLLMLPLVYMTLGLALSKFSDQRGTRWQRLLPAAALGVLLLVNGAVFVGRTLLVLAQWNERSPQIAERLAEKIPAGSRVIGDFAFYFAVRSAGSDFQNFQSTIDPRITTEIRAAYHKNVYRPDYLMTGVAPDSETMRTYERELDLVKVAGPPATPEQGPLGSFLVKAASKLGFGALGTDTSYRGYHGIIYGRRSALQPLMGPR